MANMQTARRPNTLVRTALAVVFGVMSLLHGPVMTFAKASPAPAHHAMNSDSHKAGHHHHPSAHNQQSAPSIPDTIPVCNALGCFIALESIAIGPPAASLIPIATLSPAAAQAMVPAYLDPVVPPPRLQV